MKHFRNFVENDEEYWKQKQQQYTLASKGHKGAIKDDRSSSIPTYKPPQTASMSNAPMKKEFIRMSDGYYEKMTPEDEKNGLTTLSTWERPASDGAYYKKDKVSGRFVIVRPNQALGNFYNK